VTGANDSGVDSAVAHAPELDAGRLRDRLVQLEPAAALDPRRIRVARAPGRVNLIGEHTDYNLGLVLPAAIDLEIRIAFIPTEDRRVELVSDATGERASFDLDAIGPRAGGMASYVAGTAWALAEAGIPMRGFRGILASSLPRASGLSSSAALELAAAWALAIDPAAVPPLDLARICQRAENAYVGVNCGLMDQFAIACGVAGGAMLLDCRSLAWRPVALPLIGHTLVVIHTGSTRSLSASQYNARRAQCEAAVAALAVDDPGIRSLRDVTEAMLPAVATRVDEETFRRCRHVVTENARVEAAIEALAASDLATVGRTWAGSHASLRDDFEVVSPELDALVEIAVATPGVAAARMTGAGFGGCTVNLVEWDAVAVLRDRVLAEYPARTGLLPRVFAVDAVAGAGFVDPA
jgi:galactokinase